MKQYVCNHTLKFLEYRYYLSPNYYTLAVIGTKGPLSVPSTETCIQPSASYHTAKQDPTCKHNSKKMIHQEAHVNIFTFKCSRSVLKFCPAVEPLCSREEPTRAQLPAPSSVMLLGNDLGSLATSPTLRLPCHSLLDNSVNST